MKRILVIGAGRSATALIDYLLKQAADSNWHITIADMDQKLAEEKLAGNAHGSAIRFDIRKEDERRTIISNHDLVVSMLPAFMHMDVARDCIEFGKHLATASYVSADMRALDVEAKKKGLFFLNECGLDPGLDHASAMKMIHHIHDQKGEIKMFKSYCGGLVAPASNDNPWGYKFSWNPRNVVLAGQGTAQFLQASEVKYIPYNRIFSQIDVVKVDGFGSFDAYANRDSISYIDVYGLKNIETMVRGTLRELGYCKAWNVFVKLGLTDDTSKMVQTDKMTYTDLIRAFLPEHAADVKAELKTFVGAAWDAELEAKMNYLELFSNKPIRLKEGSPAQLLQDLLEEKWKLKAGDRDMIVMQHEFEYLLPGDKKSRKLNSAFVLEGKDEQQTAMALTVGLPLAITVKNFLQGKIKLSGVQIPTSPEIYEPMLSELETLGIHFKESFS